MQRGAEVKVGLIALLALALLAFFVFVIVGYRFTSHTYKVCATFDSAEGIQRGDPVMLAGVRIGEVSAVTVDPQLRAQLTLSIERQYPLYDSYQFQIASSGLIQQLSVEVLPGPARRAAGRAAQTEPVRARHHLSYHLGTSSKSAPRCWAT